jgi:hypothetical protein
MVLAEQHRKHQIEMHLRYGSNTVEGIDSEERCPSFAAISGK